MFHLLFFFIIICNGISKVFVDEYVVGFHYIYESLFTILISLFNSTQHQAGEAEKRIKAEFERLHKVLVQEEAKRLEALSNEEQKKLEIMQRAIDMAEEDIVKMKELIETVKREMGNEDLLLLKVNEGSSFKAVMLY